MSDGPHKSLPLRRPWKAVCEIADNAAHSLEEVVERMPAALAADIRGEMSEGFVASVRDALLGDSAQPSLFDDAQQAIAAVRSAACSTMESDFADAVCDALRDGDTGLSALRNGAAAAIEDRAHAAIRAVEEHYLVESPKARADHVRDRLHAGLVGAGRALSDLADGLAAGTIKLTVAPAPDRSGLDDGVPL